MAAQRPSVVSVEEIARVCARGLDATALYQDLLPRLRRQVPFDALCWNTTDPDTLLATGVRTEHMPEASPAAAARFFENEYVFHDVIKFSALARRRSPVGILSDATGGEPRQSRRYRLINGPLGLEHELRTAFVTGGACWATASFHRQVGAPDFTPDEAAFLASVSGLVGQALRVALLLNRTDATTTATSTQESWMSGLVLLDERYELVSMTPAAQHWLGELPASDFSADAHATGTAVTPVGASDLSRGRLPAAVYAVAASVFALSAPEGKSSHSGGLRPARVRLQTRSGQWLILHGADVSERGHTPSSTGERPDQARTDPSNSRRIAVLIEPARPPDVLPLIEQAYGLT
ncbi:MAG TPA: hypothetical protein VGW38_03585, partial [Chloroflexota bacterium]|nr:hypothetical protein [Chloroflexota bacterium]